MYTLPQTAPSDLRVLETKVQSGNELPVRASAPLPSALSGALKPPCTAGTSLGTKQEIRDGSMELNRKPPKRKKIVYNKGRSGGEMEKRSILTHGTGTSN